MGLIFISDAGFRQVPSGGKRRIALYRCSCGKEKKICISEVKRGKIISCGCANIKQLATIMYLRGKDKASYRHGMFGTRFHHIYFGMARRCSDKSIRWYGAKGIKNNFRNFEHFMETMLESYKIHCLQFGIKQTTLDRIDSSKNYEPLNCRWATYTEQANNRSKRKRRVHEKSAQHTPPSVL